MKKLLAFLFVACAALSVNAATFHRSDDDTVYVYTGASGQDPDDYTTWTISSTTNDDHSQIFPPYAGCPETCDDNQACCDADYRAWFEDVFEAQVAQYNRCEAANCAQRVGVKCALENYSAWLAGGSVGDQGTGYCKQGTWVGRSYDPYYPIDGYGCSCECEGTHITGRRIVYSFCEWHY